jgi:hypothetical protein
MRMYINYVVFVLINIYLKIRIPVRFDSYILSTYEVIVRRLNAFHLMYELRNTDIFIISLSHQRDIE